MHRREFLQLGAAAVFAGTVHKPQAAPDLVIKGGRVIDPGLGLSAVRDIVVSNNRVQRIVQDFEGTAKQVIDASGKIVTPGLVDIHVHVYEGVSSVAINADASSVAKGATTVVDAGSAGATTFPGFRKYVIDRSATRVYALLNISNAGLVLSNEYADLAYVNAAAAQRVIESNRDVILGIKVRMTPNIAGGQDLEVLRRARQVADATGVAVMVHIGGGASPLKDILSLLKQGDVVTHALHARSGQIIDADGKIVPDVTEARGRGIWMDIGHGSGNLSFAVAEKAMAAGFVPDTISSDIHSRNVNGPVYDLATTMSKFMLLGMTLEQVVGCATTTAAKAFKFPLKVGTLAEGSDADIAVFSLEEGQFEFTDSVGQKRTGRQKLTHFATIRSGNLIRG
jgi:dihydroorotase